MKNKVIIKGNKYGITIVLDSEIEFSELIKELKLRLEASDNFFDSEKQIAVSFEGRELSNDQLDSILSIIKDNSKLNIQYIIDENSNNERIFQQVIYSDNNVNNYDLNNNEPITEHYSKDDIITDIDDDLQNNDITSVTKDNIINTQSVGMFYKGTLRSGQKLEADDSISSVSVNGSLGSLEMYSKTNLSLSGSGAEKLNVNLQSGATGSVVKSSVPVNMEMYGSADLYMEEGAEESSISVLKVLFNFTTLSSITLSLAYFKNKYNPTPNKMTNTNIIIKAIPFSNCQALESLTILKSFVNSNITIPISMNNTTSFNG